jgi:hypothetical protein
MKWEDKALEALRSEFRNRIFSVKDASNILHKKRGYSKGTVYRILHDLYKRGLADRLGRGIYRVPMVLEPKEKIIVSDKVSVDLIPGPLTKTRELLRSKGIEFMITGSSVLYRYLHHLPKRLIHLVYVVKGAGEPAVTLLREAGLRALLNPNSNEISLALENFPERDIFVVREYSELLGNVDGNACLERALVDLYFESTRKRMSFPEEEVSRIFLKALRTESISLSRLFLFANRRGIKEEMKAIAKFIEPEIPVEVKARNKYVRKFLKAMEIEASR